MDDITKARTLRQQMTDAERILWHRLRRRGLSGYKFRRQQPIGPYIVDFVCLSQRLVVEVDGGQHTESIADDRARSQWLQTKGYRVIRFWNHEVLTETDQVLESILEALTVSNE
jgi:adenine-specific DNA-methyltransferase